MAKYVTFQRCDERGEVIVNPEYVMRIGEGDNEDCSKLAFPDGSFKSVKGKLKDVAIKLEAATKSQD